MPVGWGDRAGGGARCPAPQQARATVLWALSSALQAARQGCSIPGILALAFMSSVGGGMVTQRPHRVLHLGPGAAPRACAAAGA
ncbi:MAG: TRIC cation channel family protein [Prochlorococcaceae cyanobacterium]